MTIAIPSRSRPGQAYAVTLHADGTAACPCPAGLFHKPCRHVAQARQELERRAARLSLLGAIASVRSRSDTHPESFAYYRRMLADMEAQLARQDRAGTPVAS